MRLGAGSLFNCVLLAQFFDDEAEVTRWLEAYADSLLRTLESPERYPALALAVQAQAHQQVSGAVNVVRAWRAALRAVGQAPGYVESYRIACEQYQHALRRHHNERGALANASSVSWAASTWSPLSAQAHMTAIRLKFQR